MKDDQIKEIDEEIEKKREVKSPDALDRIPKTYKIIGLVITFFSLYKLSMADETWSIQFVGGIILATWIVLYVVFKEDPEEKKQLLSEHECATRLYAALRKTQQFPLGRRYRIDPNAEIIIGIVGKVKFVNDKPKYRTVDFMINDGNEITKYYAMLDPFFGTIIGSIRIVGSFRGDEKKDVTFVPSDELKRERFREKYKE